MIVRINQIDLSRAEAASGWGMDPRRGAIPFPWPANTYAYEVLVLEVDEQNRPMPEAFRELQLRQMINETAAALIEPGEEMAWRLDGLFTERELLPALRHLADPAHAGRFVLSEVGKLEPEAKELMASLRMHLPTGGIVEICVDPDLGLTRSVRLRGFAVPSLFINPLLQIGLTDDPRWERVLPESGFMLSTMSGLRGLQVITPRFEASMLKSRLSRRLLETAQRAAKPEV